MDITSEHMRNFSTNGAVLLKGAFSEFVEDAQNAIAVSYTHLTLPTILRV